MHSTLTSFSRPRLIGLQKICFQRNKIDKNAKICFLSLIGHVRRHAGHFDIKSTAADKKSWKGTWEFKSRTPVETVALLYVCTSPAVLCLLLVPQGPSGPIGWPQSRRGFRCSWMYWPFWTVSTMSTLPRRSAAANTRTAAVAAPTAVPTIIDIFFHTGTGVIFSEEDLNEANVPCDQE